MKDDIQKLNEEIRETLINELIDLRGKEKSLFNDLCNNRYNNSLSIKINLHLLSEQIETIKQILINNKF